MITRIINYSQRLSAPHRWPSLEGWEPYREISCIAERGFRTSTYNPIGDAPLGQPVEIWKIGTYIRKRRCRHACVPENAPLRISAAGASSQRIDVRLTQFLPPVATNVTLSGTTAATYEQYVLGWPSSPASTGSRRPLSRNRIFSSKGLLGQFVR